jgi:hypothetical protein
MTAAIEYEVLHAPSSTISLLDIVMPTKTPTDVVDTIQIACEEVGRQFGFTHDTTTTGEPHFETAQSSFGTAIIRMDEDEIILDATRLKRIYDATATPEKKVRDKGASGRIRTDFPVNMADYESGRYDD